MWLGGEYILGFCIVMLLNRLQSVDHTTERLLAMRWVGWCCFGMAEGSDAVGLDTVGETLVLKG